MTQPASSTFDNRDLPYPLGRVQGPEDPRDKNFPFSVALPSMASTRTYRYWMHGAIKLNQGNEPSCVGQTGANWEQSSPTRTKITSTRGSELYRECKKIDGYPGDGTWDRVLMKVLESQGRIERYLWAANPMELDQWLLEKGPVLIGVPWYSDMFWTDKNGFMKVGGAEVGGHEVLLRGVNVKTGVYTITNSWGKGWGVNGDARIKRDDLAKVLWQSWGTACTAVERTVT